MQHTPPTLRPRLTLRILVYATLDIAGMILFASGVMWLTQGQDLLFRHFLTGTTDAVVVTIAGLLLMFWSAAQILRELLRTPPARHE